MVYYLMILVKYSGNWTFIQRFYSVRDERASQKQGLLTAVFFFLFPIIFLFPSIAAKALIPNLGNPEMAYVSVCLKLLPEGIMGLMVAAMFAATMSVLSGEYNVTAGVLTRDIYQRLFNANAADKEMLWVGRLMTLVLGALVTIGALYVGGFGGAFEANKLFTGLFAIPMTLPLVLGIVLKRPQPWGALATLLVGMGLGLILNTMPQVSWEWATLIEIIACVLVFLLSGALISPTDSYRQRVEAFFRRLSTPLTEAEKPAENPVFMQIMNRLYAVALVVTGALFMVMSLPSIDETSGRVALGAGLICLLLSGLMWYRTRKMPPVSEPVEFNKTKQIIEN
jgi:SSS family solute:Na+ symporter